MSMLAEKKAKQKFSLNPRGLAWANDDSKLGQKMMEKMGWSKGKGLGANETGEVDFVKVSLKSDKKGIGCTHQSANNWIAHQDDFASILANLGTEHNVGNDAKETTVDQAKLGMSVSNNNLLNLEEKSKNSLHRVHYQKFTRSKNLATKEQKDLDCIFGKRINKNDDKLGIDEEFIKSPETDQSTENQDNDQSGRSDFQFGVHTITRTSSMADYFAQKMANLKKSKSCLEFSGAIGEVDNNFVSSNDDVGNCGIDDNDISYTDVGGDNDSKCKIVIGAASDDEDDYKNNDGGGDDNDQCDKQKLVKKKKKKRKHEVSENEKLLEKKGKKDSETDNKVETNLMKIEDSMDSKKIKKSSEKIKKISEKSKKLKKKKEKH